MRKYTPTQQQPQRVACRFRAGEPTLSLPRSDSCRKLVATTTIASRRSRLLFMATRLPRSREPSMLIYTRVWAVRRTPDLCVVAEKNVAVSRSAPPAFRVSLSLPPPLSWAGGAARPAAGGTEGAFRPIRSLDRARFFPGGGASAGTSAGASAGVFFSEPDPLHLRQPALERLSQMRFPRAPTTL